MAHNITDDDLLERCNERLPDLISDIRRLVTHESPSEDLDAVAASAALVAEVGGLKLGTQPEVLTVEGATHVRWRFGDGVRRVLVLGHHDTVWPLGSLLAHPWDLTDGIIRGPGSFDMKAGVVQAIYALALLRDAGGSNAIDGVTLLVTGDEELGSPTSRQLIESEATSCEAALVLEAAGPGGALKTERKGVSLYDITIHGRAAHAGLEPERGVNAGVELAHQILALSELSDADHGTTVTPTTCRAGTTSNTVPAVATLRVDVRVRTAGEQERVQRAIKELRPHLEESRIEIAGGPNRPPFHAEHSEALFARATRLADRSGIGPLNGIRVGGASDGNFTAGIGVPTLDGLGAVGGGAHADDEHVVVDAIASRTALLALLVDDLLTTGRSS